MIAAGFTGKIWTVWAIGGLLCEGRIICAKCAKSLICRNMQEMKVLSVFHFFLMRTGRLKQAIGPNEICLDKGLWPLDRPIHMRVGCKMKHCINRLFLQYLLDSIRICDVSLDETKPRILAVLRKVLPPTRIGQLVQHHYPAYPGH